MSSPPPLHAAAEDDNAQWQRFAAPADEAEFCQGWLDLLCRQVPGAQAGLLCLVVAPGELRQAGSWPAVVASADALSRLAERVAAQGVGTVDPPSESDQCTRVGYPVEVDGRLCAVAAFALATRADELVNALRLIHWGSAWMVAHFSRRLLADRDQRLHDLALATEVLAAAMQHTRHDESALAVVNEIATRLRCDRVSLGAVVEDEIELRAISNVAHVDRKSTLVRHLRQAMEEALDLGQMVWLPLEDDHAVQPLVHRDVARELGVAALCTAPLSDDVVTVAALTLERSGGPPFTERERALLRATGGWLGPVFALKQHAEQSIARRVRHAGRGALAAVAGGRHPGILMLVAVFAALTLFLALFTVDHRVTATALIEGEVQRAAAVPFDGYVVESYVRAGDLVAKGQVLARLDDRELRLEQARWQSDHEQARRKFRAALAAQDRSGMAVLEAQVRQAHAQLQLVDERLARSNIVAPLDGVVVSGDLTQSLGAPVEQGKVLFEVAPRDRHRVILKVDERDIAHLQAGQRGELVLTGLPDRVMEVTVRHVTPVSTPQEGRNFFRVEASVDAGPQPLRPGMEGVGKITVGRARLVWVWTHPLVDWLRIAAWTWTP